MTQLRAFGVIIKFVKLAIALISHVTSANDIASDLYKH
jgi:hypothetical protein